MAGISLDQKRHLLKEFFEKASILVSKDSYLIMFPVGQSLVCEAAMLRLLGYGVNRKPPRLWRSARTSSLHGRFPLKFPAHVDNESESHRTAVKSANALGWLKHFAGLFGPKQKGTAEGVTGPLCQDEKVFVALLIIVAM